MVVVQEKLVSEDVFKKRFVCDLNACKGACCWEGDLGAPLEAEEVEILQTIRENLRPYLPERANEALDQNGTHTVDELTKLPSTTLLDNGPCAYMTKDEKGIAQCGIELAWKDGAVDFQKPISCHLYPIRVVKNPQVGFEALNYEEWDICSAACTKGAELKVPVYQFLKTPLIRKYGASFYEEMERIGKDIFE